MLFNHCGKLTVDCLHNLKTAGAAQRLGKSGLKGLPLFCGRHGQIGMEYCVDKLLMQFSRFAGIKQRIVDVGAAILEAFKDAKGMEPVPIGSYRGFAMSLTVEDFGRDFILTLKGKMNHRVTLGKDARGNLTRIDNALNAMPDRLQNVRNTLDALTAQMETAKAELGKPFPQEEELRIKSARLAELNAELNIDDRTPMEQMAEDAPAVQSAKAERPSVLAKLKAPLSQPCAEDKIRHRNKEER